MLPEKTQYSQQALAYCYFKESNNYLMKDYTFRIADNYSTYGIRYLNYFEQKNTLLISNVSNGRVHLLNLMTGQLDSFTHHQTTVRKILTFKNDIITASWDGTVRVTDFDTLSQRLVLTDKSMGRCPYINITPDGKYLYSFTYDSDIIPLGMANTIRKFCLKTGRILFRVAASSFAKSQCRSGSIILWKNKLYECSDSGYFRIFDLRNGRFIKEIVTQYDYRTMTSLFHYNYLLASDWQGRIHFFNLKTNKFDYAIQAHNSDILSIRVHPKNPNILFTSGNDGMIRVWEMPEFRLLNTIFVNQRDLWSFVFINDRVVVGNFAGEIRIYKISNFYNLSYIGRIILSDHSFVAQTTGSKLFFTNNLESIEISPVNNDTALSSREKEYLLNQNNNLMALRELFGFEEVNNGYLKGQHNHLPLLAQSFK
jgi:WD40 repeat protein